VDHQRRHRRRGRGLGPHRRRGRARLPGPGRHPGFTTATSAASCRCGPRSPPS
jgi:hypothetical protein